MYNMKNHHFRKNVKLAEICLKQVEDRNKRLQNKIESKSKENTELYEEYRKCKRFYNEVLHQIKDLDWRLEERDKIIKEYEAYKEYLRYDKIIVEEERSQLCNKVKLLEERLNKALNQIKELNWEWVNKEKE